MLNTWKERLILCLHLLYELRTGRGSAQQIEDTQLTILDSEAKSWYKDGHRTNSQEMAPSKAYDGDYSTFYSVKDGDADGNFLKLHLQMVYLITRVKVTNRLDGCCAQRILDTVIKVQVEVGGSVRDTGTCGTIADYDSDSASAKDHDKQTFELLCQGVLGNRIHISDLTPGELGHGISEVQVFGSENIILFPSDLYRLRKVDGPAAGLFISYTSELRNDGSYYIHAQPGTIDDKGELWKITHNIHRGQSCYHFQATTGINMGRILVVHGDTQEGHTELARALVHSADHRLDDECWTIEEIPSSNGENPSYQLTKTMSRHSDKHLVSLIERDASTFWVDVSSDDPDVLWQILPQIVPQIEACKAEYTYIIVNSGQSLNITFTLPSDSSLVNITRTSENEKKDVTSLFTEPGTAGVYSFIKPAADTSDEGIYLMYHEVLELHVSSCSSTVVLAVPKEISKIGLLDVFKVELSYLIDDLAVILLDGSPSQNLSYQLTGSEQCTTIEWSITVEDNILAIKGVSSCMTADTVIFKLDSTVADFDFRVEFPMPDSGKCSKRKIRCDGVIDCNDMSDEMSCSDTGVYSRMALYQQEENIRSGIHELLYIPTPDSSYTVCLFSFGSEVDMSFLMEDERDIRLFTGPGYYCLTHQHGTIMKYRYEGENFRVMGEPDVLVKVPAWAIYFSGIVKNVLVYNKALTEMEMKNYITDCGEPGYSDGVSFDYHAIITMNLLLLQKFQIEEVYSPYSYSVLTSMCEEKVTPSSELDLMNSYICASGTVIQEHCKTGGKCDASSLTECDYVESNIVAMAAAGNSCKIESWIKNAWNNILGVTAISAANIRCTGGDCVEEAFLQYANNSFWANGRPLTYTNWEQETSRAEGRVYLKSTGKWHIKDAASVKERQLCNLAEEATSLANKGITDFTSDRNSTLRINKSSALNKITICWAATGSGDLLHYMGQSYISEKDIYIRMETNSEDSSKTFLTVYIAGFPEYFELDQSETQQYVCVRWEKLTGRIDLAVKGKWVVGKNSYASSRKAKLSKSGRLTVGSAIMSSATPAPWSGTVHNLVIWDAFYNPLILKKTSMNLVCAERSKSKAWLTFEEIIAGCSDSEMFNTIDACNVQPSLQKRGVLPKSDSPKSVLPLSEFSHSESSHSESSHSESSLEKRAPSFRKRSTGSDITINYNSFVDVSDPADLSQWIRSSDASVAVRIPATSYYTVRRADNEFGSIKLEPLSSLCLTGLSETQLYTFTLTVHNSELALFQVGDQTLQADVGNPADVEYSNVFAVDGEVCITNVLSPSDYYPIDGFIDKISYDLMPEVIVLCPGEVEDLQDKGNISWPATFEINSVTLICPYGKSPEKYNEIGFAIRACTASGWTTSSTSDCAKKLYISNEEAVQYFNDTEVTNDTVEEYADTINKVVQANETVSEAQLETASVALEELSKSEGVEITEYTMGSVVEVADTINRKTDANTVQQQETESQAASKIVESVATLVAKVNLSGNTSKFASTTETVSVAAVNPNTFDVDDSAGIVADFNQGIAGTNIDVHAQNNDKKKTDSITITREKIKTAQNVWFTRYKKDSSLFASNTAFKIDGEILGAGIGEELQNFGSDKGVEMKFYTSKDTRNMNALCQYWEMSETGSQTGWNSRGMKLVEKTADYIVCESSHLTNFAILVNPSNTIFSGTQLKVLEWITKLGCSLSIVGLLFTIVGLSVFKKIRSVLVNRVHIGLSTSLLFAYFFLLIGAEKTGNKGVCYFFSIVIHFCFLCAFCWMSCEAVNLYQRLVIVFDSDSHMFLKFSIVSFFLPTVIVLITVIVEFAGGNGAYLMTDPASARTIYCWLDYKARMVAFMVPLLIMLIINFVLFFRIMRVLFASKKIVNAVEADNKAKWLSRLRSTVAVSTLIGLTWILGIFAIGDASFTFNVLFALFSSIQGCVICYLFCLAKKDVVTQWKSSFTSTVSRTSADKGGLSSSNQGVQPQYRAKAVANKTNASSVGMSQLSSKPSNVYSNELTSPESFIKEKPAVYQEPAEDTLPTPETEDMVPTSDSGSGLSTSVEDKNQEEHIYEELPGEITLPCKRKYIPNELPEESPLIMTISRTLKGEVKEKVETFEGIIAGTDVRLSTPNSEDMVSTSVEDKKQDVRLSTPDAEDMVPTSIEDKKQEESVDSSASFQIKSDRQSSEGNGSPFDL